MINSPGATLTEKSQGGGDSSDDQGQSDSRQDQPPIELPRIQLPTEHDQAGRSHCRVDHNDPLREHELLQNECHRDADAIRGIAPGVQDVSVIQSMRYAETEICYGQVDDQPFTEAPSSE